MKIATTKTQCCIVGGGPAGIMCGYLLARQGIKVDVLEKWPDFFRDFRGDTIHPSTMELLHQLGLLEKFQTIPHADSPTAAGMINGEEVVIADFSHLKVKAPYVAFMPQWDFLNFLSGEAKKYPNFTVHMETEAYDLIKKGDEIIGVKAKTKNSTVNIYADLVIGADGRHSIIREKSKLKKYSDPVPMDVLWFPIPRKKDDPTSSLAYLASGQFLVLLERDSYWQCAYPILKGTWEKIQQEDIKIFHKKLAGLVGLDSDRFRAITEWSDLKLLSVTVDHLKKWHLPGLLCIGDAAHAMSPLGGVGINLAIQDAVAAARIVGPELKKGRVKPSVLNSVKKRRLFPARAIQIAQNILQNQVITPLLKGKNINRIPLPFILLNKFPILQRIPAYLIGIGLRPEYIDKKFFK